MDIWIKKARDEWEVPFLVPGKKKVSVNRKKLDKGIELGRGGGQGSGFVHAVLALPNRKLESQDCSLWERGCVWKEAFGSHPHRGDS